MAEPRTKRTNKTKGDGGPSPSLPSPSSLPPGDAGGFIPAHGGYQKLLSAGPTTPPPGARFPRGRRASRTNDPRSPLVPRRAKTREMIHRACRSGFVSGSGVHECSRRTSARRVHQSGSPPSGILHGASAPANVSRAAATCSGLSACQGGSPDWKNASITAANPLKWSCAGAGGR